MKKSKILVPALAVLALGVAGASVGTVAWFEAAAEAHVVNSDHDFNVTTSSIEQGDFYFKVVATHTGNVEYTDKTGQGWVVANGAMAKATATVKYGDCTLVLKGYKNEACTEEANAEELKAVGTVSFTVSIKAEDQARITYLDPSSNFATAFADNFENTLAAAAKVENGVMTIGQTAGPLGGDLHVYYSVSGNADNSVPSVGDAVEGETPEVGKQVGNIAITLTK